MPVVTTIPAVAAPGREGLEDARLDPSGERAGRSFVDAVAAWLGLELAGEGDAEAAASSTPVASFGRGGVTFVWSAYAWDSRDTKRPEAAPRPARGRTLVAANAWTQALVTGCWWAVDAARARASVGRRRGLAPPRGPPRRSTGAIRRGMMAGPVRLRRCPGCAT